MVQRSAPLAEQLVNELAAQIENGDIVGDSGRLPSEAELCQRYSVSRATLREALSKLELAGMIIRRHGVGTFVNHAWQSQPGPVRGWLDEAPAFVDLITASGHAADCKLLAATAIPVPSQTIAERLGISNQEQVISINKLFFADDIPVIYSHTLLPGQLLETDEQNLNLTEEAFRDPIYKVLAERCGHKVHHQTSEIKAVLADMSLAELLDCRAGDPLLQVEETGYSQAQTALFYALHHFRGDQVSFRQIRIPSFTIDSA
jgi:GntR family transcriptional regulator